MKTKTKTNGNPPRARQRVSSRQQKDTQDIHTISLTNSTKIRINGKVVGIVQNGSFVKNLRGSVHFLRIPPSISFDKQSLVQAEQAGAQYVLVTDVETGHIYRVALSTIWSKGFSVNRGYGEQIALPLSYWARGDDPVGQQLLLWSQP